MPKLPKGMYRRGSVFYCRLYEGGRELRRSLGSDYDDARRRLREHRNHLQPILEGRSTVQEVASKWLETAVPTGRNAKGVRDATTRVRKYLVPCLGHRLLASITRNDLREYRRWLERQGSSTSLVHHVLTDARCFFRWCEGSELIGRAPVPPRWLPRLPERAPDRLSADEAVAVAAVREPFGFVVRFALATGLRWGELARAESSDIWQGVLVVRQSKSGKVRRVPLSRAILAEIEQRPGGRLVPFAKAETVAKRVRRYSNVASFHFHQTRHTFACSYLERGGSLHALQQLLGHSSVLVTQRYAKLSDAAVLAEHRRLESAEIEMGTNRHTSRHSGPNQASRKHS